MYTSRGTLDRQAAVNQYGQLVRRVAAQLIAKLPANVEMDDLVQAGMIGLFDALSRYQTDQGAQFETFAMQRVRGREWLSTGLGCWPCLNCLRLAPH